MRVPFHDHVNGWQTAPWGSRSGGERSEPQRSEPQGAVRVLVLVGDCPNQPGIPTSSKPARISSGPHSPLIGFPQFPNQQSDKMNPPFRLAQELQSHRVPNEGFPHKAFAPAPFDLAIASHLAPHRSWWVLGKYLASTRQAFWSINFPWRPLPQSFVGPNLIVASDPSPGPPLLRSHIARRGSCRFGFEHPMHLFVRPILFWMPRSYELDLDSHGRPPCAQARKPRWPGRSERSAIVHADDLGIAVTPKQPQKNSTNRPPTLVGQQAYSQQVTTEQIANRQGLDPASVLSPKPALEIDRPNLIALLGHRQSTSAQGRTSRRTPTTAAAQLHSLEPLANRACSRRTLTPIQLAQSSGKFPASPASMSPSQPPDPTQPYCRGLPRGLVRTTSSISQSSTSFLFESCLPFVAIPTTQSKGLTQLRHALLGLQSQLHKLQSSHHTRDFFPGHAPEKAEK